MRQEFFDIIKKQAQVDKNIILMSADLAPRYFKDFQKQRPRQFINAGIAEANMIGAAAGLALAGKNVYCYSIIPFLIMRALEQIRVDLCAHNLNVKLLGAGGGLVYGLEGMTHHAIEDIALMRALPNMSVAAPGDAYEAQVLAQASIKHQGPLYIRLGQDKNPLVHKKLPRFKIGQGIIIKQGKNISLIAAGSMLYQASLVLKNLEKKGLKPNLISLPTIKPLDIQLIKKISQENHVIFTIEDHSQIGGLGSAVADALTEINYQGLFKKIALPDQYSPYIGQADYLYQKHHLSSQAITSFILKQYQHD